MGFLGVSLLIDQFSSWFLRILNVGWKTGVTFLCVHHQRVKTQSTNRFWGLLMSTDQWLVTMETECGLVALCHCWLSYFPTSPVCRNKELKPEAPADILSTTCIQGAVQLTWRLNTNWWNHVKVFLIKELHCVSFVWCIKHSGNGCLRDYIHLSENTAVCFHGDSGCRLTNESHWFFRQVSLMLEHQAMSQMLLPSQIVFDPQHLKGNIFSYLSYWTTVTLFLFFLYFWCK